MASQSKFITLAGLAGCLGAILVGVGEFSLQFTPNGGIEDVKDYLYFNDVSASRLSFGHFLAVLSAPLYICLLYTSPSPRDQRGSRMPSSA